jgi:hypothetical protein
MPFLEFPLSVSGISFQLIFTTYKHRNIMVQLQCYSTTPAIKFRYGPKIDPYIKIFLPPPNPFVIFETE